MVIISYPTQSVTSILKAEKRLTTMPKSVTITGDGMPKSVRSVFKADITGDDMPQSVTSILKAD